MVVCVVMDGFGERKEIAGNAIKSEGTPNLDTLCSAYPHTTLVPFGEAVGLEKGQEGNSEAGHINMGAGRIVRQDLEKINYDIACKNTFANKTLNECFSHVRKYGGTLHFMGLCSNEGVHSKLDHLEHLVWLAKRTGAKKIALHLFSDGRDSSPTSAMTFIHRLKKSFKKYKDISIATICGRLYAMDRESRFERLQPAYEAIVNANSEYNFESPEECFDHFYKNGITDEFVLPSLINGGTRIEDNDAVIFFNFRSDRARELSEAITSENYKPFPTRKINNLFFAGMTQYDQKLANVKTIFIRDSVFPPVGEILAENGLTQLRISETTKYAHVTFFFNGGRETPYKGESRILIESMNIKNFDEAPEMRAKEITEKVIDAVQKQSYDFVLVNLSNCDMVGHTGNFEATKQAVSVVDECAGQIAKACLEQGVDLIITADHGNADVMLDKHNKPVTSHSASLVPFILVSEKNKNAQLIKNAPLSSIAPTILKLLGISPPAHFLSKPLFK